MPAWEPSGELQESLGPSGPEIEEKSEKCLQAPPAPGAPKSLEKVSRESRTGIFETFLSLFRDSFETFSGRFPGFGGPAEAPADVFQTCFLGFRARSQRDSCSSSEGSKTHPPHLQKCALKIRHSMRDPIA